MKIILADDHALFREGISHVLKDLDQQVTILEASGVEQALEAARHHADIDLVLLDLNMPGQNGFEALQTFSTEFPTLPVVVLSASESRNDMQRALDLGAMGYISKGSTSNIMLNALRLVLSGEVYVPSYLLQNKVPEEHSLTQRQLDVLTLMDQGHSNKVIASMLDISEATVKMHVTAIFRELQVSNRTQAVLKAQKLKLL